MDCPHCGHDSTKVLDTRTCRGDRVRKRRCGSCGRRFSTAERVTVEYMQVRKRDGTVEWFSRAKLRCSVLHAATGTDLSTQDVDAFVDRVTEILQPDAPDIPIPSQRIGELVLEQMHSNKACAGMVRVRYALGFLGGTAHGKGFRGLDDLEKWLMQTYGPPRLERHGSGPQLVRKRDGGTEPFSLEKLVHSIMAAAIGRGTPALVRKLARTVAAAVARELNEQGLVTSQQIASETLAGLSRHDPVAYVRYAVAVKRHTSIDDVWLDVRALRDLG